MKLNDLSVEEGVDVVQIQWRADRIGLGPSVK